jgi:isocitrate dehydrogenase
VITKFSSERIEKYVFEYAYLNNRKNVTAVHKANIMKLADGLFLESYREVAKKYPRIKYNEIIVDNCCMQLVAKPEQIKPNKHKSSYNHKFNPKLDLANHTNSKKNSNKSKKK